MGWRWRSSAFHSAARSAWRRDQDDADNWHVDPALRLAVSDWRGDSALKPAPHDKAVAPWITPANCKNIRNLLSYPLVDLKRMLSQ